ncbi:acyl-CoA dehydrogenase family protein [Streptomyces sp. NPDC005322]|uniref:acyl-CoA dehydrogenase family protein n=1 Tax=unclassified Streptomyces TaxID=2593676 RepID=UPI00339E935E
MGRLPGRTAAVRGHAGHADMLVRAGSARRVVYAAAVTEDRGDIAAAKLPADEAAVRDARDCRQVHGGMGYAW